MSALSPLQQVIRTTPYPAEAFEFLERGLEFSAKRVHGERTAEAADASRHVSGAELAAGLRDFAILEYGLLARFVLARWRIQRTRDFGEMVFALVNADLMKKTDDDRVTDFDEVYDFDAAFPTELTLTTFPADCHGQD